MIDVILIIAGVVVTLLFVRSQILRTGVFSRSVTYALAPVSEQVAVPIERVSYTILGIVVLTVDTQQEYDRGTNKG